MAITITDWRCPSGRCHGSILARRVTITAGWIEIKCRKCGTISHAGEARKDGEVVALECGGESGHRHTIAQAAATWAGSVTIYCRRCHHDTTHSPASP